MKTSMKLKKWLTRLLLAMMLAVTGGGVAQAQTYSGLTFVAGPYYIYGFQSKYIYDNNNGYVYLSTHTEADNDGAYRWNIWKNSDGSYYYLENVSTHKFFDAYDFTYGGYDGTYGNFNAMKLEAWGTHGEQYGRLTFSTTDILTLAAGGTKSDVRIFEQRGEYGGRRLVNGVDCPGNAVNDKNIVYAQEKDAGDAQKWTFKKIATTFDAPTLTIGTVTSSSVAMSWNNVGASTYAVLRSTDNTNFTKIADVNTTSYTDTNVTAGTTYYYKVAGNQELVKGAMTYAQRGGEGDYFKQDTQQSDGLYNAGWIGSGKWARYEVSIPFVGSYNVKLYIAKGNGQNLTVNLNTINSTTGAVTITDPNVSGDGWQVYKTYDKSINFTGTGTQNLYYIAGSDQNFWKMIFYLPGAQSIAKTAVVPSACPTAPTISAGTVTTCSIVVNLTAGTGTPDSYKLCYRVGNTGNYTDITGLSASSFPYTLSGLTQGTSYQYFVAAVKAGCAEANSVGQTTSTLALGTAAAPTLNASAAGQITVTWTNVSNASSYDIQYAKVSDFNNATTLTGKTSGFNITGLDANTTYYVRIIAKGCGTNSTTGTSANTQTSPTAPSLSNGAATSATTATFTMTGGAYSSYDVYANDTKLTSGVSKSGDVVTVSGLTANTAYTFKVKVNAGGSVESNTTSATTWPTAPTLSNAAATGATTATFTVSGGVFTNFDVYANGTKVADGNVAVSGSTVTVSGLSANTDYTFTVKVNKGGTIESAATTSIKTWPVAPASISATANSTSQITLNFGAVAGATSYKVYDNDGNQITTGITVDVANHSAVITGLNANTAYTYKVKANNGSGDSEFSATATATTFPGVPTGVGAAVNSASQITVSWTAPTGGATSYTVYNSDNSVAKSGVEGTSTAITGLTGNTSYTYYVKAVNGTGESAASDNATALTIPGAPTINCGTISATSHTVTISWTAPVGGAVSYQVWALGTSEWTDKTSASSFNGNSATMSVNNPNQLYKARVCAVNASGVSEFSEVCEVTTTSIEVPQITATPTTGQIALSWTPNANQSYDIYRSAHSALNYKKIVDASVQGNNGTYTDTNVFSGSTYYYYIVAHEPGTQGNSNVAIATTPTTLAAPTLTLTKQESTAQLSWTAVTGAGAYNIYRSVDGTNWHLEATVTGTTYNDNVVYGRTKEYFYKVTAVEDGFEQWAYVGSDTLYTEKSGGWTNERNGNRHIYGIAYHMGADGKHYNAGNIGQNAWTQYTVNTTKSGEYKAVAFLGCNQTGTTSIAFGSASQTDKSYVASATALGDWQNYFNAVGAMNFTAGSNTLYAIAGSNLNYMKTSFTAGEGAESNTVHYLPQAQVSSRTATAMNNAHIVITAIDGITKYKLRYRSDTENYNYKEGSWSDWTELNGTTTYDFTIDPTRQYEIEVIAVAADGTESKVYSNMVSAMDYVPVITPTANSTSQITVTWPTVTTATGYTLWYNTDYYENYNGNSTEWCGTTGWTQFTGDITVNAGTATAVVTGLKPSTLYFFKATATDGTSTSMPSIVKWAQTTEETTTLSRNGNTLSWTAITDATAYKVMCSTDGGAFTQLASVTAITYNVNPAPGHTYTYKIVPVSPHSDIFTTWAWSGNSTKETTVAGFAERNAADKFGPDQNNNCVEGVAYDCDGGHWNAGNSGAWMRFNFTAQYATDYKALLYIARQNQKSATQHLSASDKSSDAYMTVPDLNMPYKAYGNTNNGWQNYRVFQGTVPMTGEAQNVYYLAYNINYLKTVYYVNEFATDGTASNEVEMTVALEAPSISLGNATKTSLQVTWGNVSGADAYTIEYSANQTDWTVASTEATSPYTISGLSGATTYYVRAKSTIAGGTPSAYSTVQHLSTASLEVTAVTTSSISLGWVAATGAASYNVYRDDALLANAASNSYVDNAVTPGSTYCYYVKPVVAGDGSTGTNALKVANNTTLYANQSVVEARNADGSDASGNLEHRDGCTETTVTFQSGDQSTNDFIRFTYNVDVTQAGVYTIRTFANTCWGHNKETKLYVDGEVVSTWNLGSTGSTGSGWCMSDLYSDAASIRLCQGDHVIEVYHQGRGISLHRLLFTRTGDATGCISEGEATNTVCQLVQAIPATAISLNKACGSAVIDNSATFVATLTPAEATDPVVWTSSNTAIATVNNGVVTAVAEGSVTITATAGSVSTTATFCSQPKSYVPAYTASFNKVVVKWPVHVNETFYYARIYKQGVGEIACVTVQRNGAAVGDTLSAVITTLNRGAYYGAGNNKPLTAEAGSSVYANVGAINTNGKCGEAGGNTQVFVLPTFVMPTGIVATPDTINIKTGGKASIYATVTPAGAPQVPEYVSQSNAIATVSAAGEVTGVAVGSTRIMVKAIDNSGGTASGAVQDIVVVNVALDQPEITTITPSYTSTEFAWNSVPDANYYIVRLFEGDCVSSYTDYPVGNVITATINGLKNNQEYNVQIIAQKRDGDNVIAESLLFGSESFRTKAYVKTITLTPSAANVFANGTVTINAAVAPTEALDKAITWTITGNGSITASGNTSCTVQINSGATEGNKIQVTATAHDGGGASATSTLTVVNVAPKEIILARPSKYILKDSTYQITVSKIIMTDGTEIKSGFPALTYTSANTAKATVSNTGLVTAVSGSQAGDKVTITIAAANGLKTTFDAYVIECDGSSHEICPTTGTYTIKQVTDSQIDMTSASTDAIWSTANAGAALNGTQVSKEADRGTFSKPTLNWKMLSSDDYIYILAEVIEPYSLRKRDGMDDFGSQVELYLDNSGDWKEGTQRRYGPKDNSTDGCVDRQGSSDTRKVWYDDASKKYTVKAKIARSGLTITDHTIKMNITIICRNSLNNAGAGYSLTGTQPWQNSDNSIVANICYGGNTCPDAIVDVDSISVKPDTTEIYMSQAFVPTITISPANATVKDVIYKSKNGLVNFVDGQVVGASEGEDVVYITTKDGGFTDSIIVTVKASCDPKIVYVNTRPTIDGTLDAVWKSIKPMAMMHIADLNADDYSTPTNVPTDNPAGFWRCAYTNDTLYVFVEVIKEADNKDLVSHSDLWHGDAIEFYMYTGLNKSTQSGGTPSMGIEGQRPDFIQIGIDCKNKIGKGGNSSNDVDVSLIKYNVSETDHGFNVEYSIPWNFFTDNPSVRADSSRYIWMEMSVDQSRNNTVRDAQVTTYTNTQNLFKNSYYFTKVEFLKLDVPSTYYVTSGVTRTIGITQEEIDHDGWESFEWWLLDDSGNEVQKVGNKATLDVTVTKDTKYRMKATCSGTCFTTYADVDVKLKNVYILSEASGTTANAANKMSAVSCTGYTNGTVHGSYTHIMTVEGAKDICTSVRDDETTVEEAHITVTSDVLNGGTRWVRWMYTNKNDNGSGTYTPSTDNYSTLFVDTIPVGFHPELYGNDGNIVSGALRIIPTGSDYITKWEVKGSALKAAGGIRPSEIAWGNTTTISTSSFDANDYTITYDLLNNCMTIKEQMTYALTIGESLNQDDPNISFSDDPDLTADGVFIIDVPCVNTIANLQYRNSYTYSGTGVDSTFLKGYTNVSYYTIDLNKYAGKKISIPFNYIGREEWGMQEVSEVLDTANISIMSKNVMLQISGIQATTYDTPTEICPEVSNETKSVKYYWMKSATPTMADYTIESSAACITPNCGYNEPMSYYRFQVKDGFCENYKDFTVQYNYVPSGADPDIAVNNLSYNKANNTITANIGNFSSNALSESGYTLKYTVLDIAAGTAQTFSVTKNTCGKSEGADGYYDADHKLQAMTSYPTAGNNWNSVITYKFAEAKSYRITATVALTAAGKKEVGTETALDNNSRIIDVCTFDRDRDTINYYINNTYVNNVDSLCTLHFKSIYGALEHLNSPDGFLVEDGVNRTLEKNIIFNIYYTGIKYDAGTDHVDIFGAHTSTNVETQAYLFNNLNNSKSDDLKFFELKSAEEGLRPQVAHVVVRLCKNFRIHNLELVGSDANDNALDIDDGNAPYFGATKIGRFVGANIVVENCKIQGNKTNAVTVSGVDGVTFNNNQIWCGTPGGTADLSQVDGGAVRLLTASNIKFNRNNIFSNTKNVVWAQNSKTTTFTNNVIWQRDLENASLITVFNRADGQVQDGGEIKLQYNTCVVNNGNKDNIHYFFDVATSKTDMTMGAIASHNLNLWYNNFYSKSVIDSFYVKNANFNFTQNTLKKNNFRPGKALPANFGKKLGGNDADALDNEFSAVACGPTDEIDFPLTGNQVPATMNVGVPLDDVVADRLHDNAREGKSVWTIGAHQADAANNVSDTIIWTNYTGDANWDTHGNWVDYNTKQQVNCSYQFGENLCVIIPKIHGSKYISEDVKSGKNGYYPTLGSLPTTVKSSVANRVAKTIILEYGGALPIKSLVEGVTATYDTIKTSLVIEGEDRGEQVMVGPSIRPYTDDKGNTRCASSEDYFRNFLPMIFMEGLNITKSASTFTAEWGDANADVDELKPDTAFVLYAPNMYGRQGAPSATYYKNKMWLQEVGHEDLEWQFGGRLEAEVTSSYTCKPGQWNVMTNTLLGNINAGKFLAKMADKFGLNEGGTIAVWTFRDNGAGSMGAFDSYTVHTTPENSYIRPQQAFFYYLPDDITENTEVDLLTNEVAICSFGVSTSYKQGFESTNPKLTIQAYAGEYSSVTNIEYNPYLEDEKLGSSAYNAMKLFTGYDYTPDICSYYGNTALYSQTINPSINVVPLAVKVGEDMKAVFAFYGAEDFKSVYLEDRLFGTQYDLKTTEELTFDLVNGFNKDRFYLVFEYDEIDDPTTDVEEFAAADLKIYTEDNENVIISSENEEVVKIVMIDMNGKSQNIRAKKMYNIINMSGYPSGVYTFKASTASKTKVEKVVIK